MDSKRQAAAKIARRLREKGFQAYFVGGCVRDLVMGREPADYDIATNATPQTVTELFPESLTVGAQFGVVVVPRQERRKSTRLNSSHSQISYAVFCLKKKKTSNTRM